MSATLDANPYDTVADLAEITRRQREVLAKVFEEAVGHTIAEVSQLVADWTELCVRLVKGNDTAPPLPVDAIRQRAARSLSALHFASRIVAEGIEPLAGRDLTGIAELPGLLVTLERLSESLALIRAPEDFRSVALRWYPLDQDAFTRTAGSFAPTQAMTDEDWSDLLPARPPG